MAERGARWYKMFYREMEGKSGFKSLQPQLFPINEHVFGFFLVWCRVVQRLKFNSIQGNIYFILLKILGMCKNGLVLYLIANGYQVITDEYNDMLNGIMIILLRAFGNQETITDAVLTSHFHQMLQVTDLNNELECRTMAIIAFICSGCYRPTSIKHMKLKDLKFEIESPSKTTTHFRLQMTVLMLKDKKILSKGHYNMFHTSFELSRDMTMVKNIE
jgi:hypothetical protein